MPFENCIGLKLNTSCDKICRVLVVWAMLHLPFDVMFRSIWRRDNFAFHILQEESEVPDDETVNQMIARNEEEFEIYQVYR